MQIQNKTTVIFNPDKEQEKAVKFAEEHKDWVKKIDDFGIYFTKTYNMSDGV